MSIFYVDVDEREKGNVDSYLSSKKLTQYNSERDIAYTGMEKTPDGNVALLDHRIPGEIPRDNLTSMKLPSLSKYHASLNYIDLDFNESKEKCLEPSSEKFVEGLIDRKEPLDKSEAEVSKYASIDFSKTYALEEASKAK